MTETDSYALRPIGMVRSRLKTREEAPRQGSEGAPDAWVEIDPAFADALDGVAVGDEIFLLTWLHLGDREMLKVHPRNDPHRRIRGVFSTRSQDRPNPIGLHRVKVFETAEPARLRVGPLEALDGTPVIDIKPVLHGAGAGQDPGGDG